MTNRSSIVTNSANQTVKFSLWRYWLAALIILLAICAAAAGLLFDNLYRDNVFLRAIWQATDMATLVLPTPIFIGALVITRRGSIHAELVWLAMLDFMLYNYAYYLFGAAFNAVFLIYVALFTFSLYGLIFGLIRLDANGIARCFSEKTPVRWISGFMLFVAVGLVVIYSAMTMNFLATGTLPAIVTLTAHPTSVVFALDLSLVVPPLLLGAVWLWQRQPWGYIVSTVALVKGAVYMMVLAYVSWRVSLAVAPEVSAEIPLWLTLGIGSAIAAAFLLGNLKNSH